MDLNEGVMFWPQLDKNLYSCVFGCKKEVAKSSFRLCKAAEASHVAGVSLNADPESPFFEALKVTSELPWRP